MKIIVVLSLVLLSLNLHASWEGIEGNNLEDPIKLTQTLEAESVSGEIIRHDQINAKFNALLKHIEVNKAGLMGSIEWVSTVGCHWENYSTGFSNFNVDNDCSTNDRILAGGAIDSSFGTLPQIKFSNLPKGHYKFTLTGAMGSPSASYIEAFRVSDGVNSSNVAEIFIEAGSIRIPTIQVSMDYDTDQTDVTFNVQGATSTGTVFYIDAHDYTGFKLSVYYYPIK